MLQRWADNCSTNCAGDFTQSNVFELRRQLDSGETLKPLFQLRRGKRVEMRQLFFVCLALGREFEIVVDEFAQQARHEAERQLLQRPQIVS